MAKYILPFATNCCDLRLNGESIAIFNEKFIIDQESQEFLKQEPIILFEILDLNLKLIKEGQVHLLDEHNHYKVAWGYIKPLGTTNINMGAQKI